MKLYSTREAAQFLGVTEDTIHSYKRAGLPMPESRIARFYAFSEQDIVGLYDWFQKKGIAVALPVFKDCLTPSSP